MVLDRKNTNTALQRLYIRPTPSHLAMVHENNKNVLWCCYLTKVAYLCNIISNCIKLLDFNLYNPDLSKIQKLIKIKKSENYDKRRKTETKPLQSRYLEIKDRRDFYERKLRDPNLGRGGRLYKLYSKALKVTKQ